MVQTSPTTARRKETLLLDVCQKSHRLSVTLFLRDYTNWYLIGLTSNRRGSQVPKQFCLKPTMVDWVAFTLPATNMAPENQWLEDVISFSDDNFFRGKLLVSNRGEITPVTHLQGHL